MNNYRKSILGRVKNQSVGRESQNAEPYQVPDILDAVRRGLIPERLLYSPIGEARAALEIERAYVITNLLKM